MQLNTLQLVAQRVRAFPRCSARLAGALGFCGIAACSDGARSSHGAATLERVQSAAVDSLPVRETGPVAADSPGWMRIVPSADSVSLRIAYATSDNIAGRVLYDCPACLLRPQVAEALRSAVRSAAAEGYGIVLFDCYRPTSVQEVLRRALNDSRYVAAPGKGSAHSRGCAVDAGLTRDGELVDMGSAFDEMTPRSAYGAPGIRAAQRRFRAALRRFFVGAGFKPYDAEWWHFALPDCAYPLSDYRWTCPDMSR